MYCTAGYIFRLYEIIVLEKVWEHAMEWNGKGQIIIIVGTLQTYFLECIFISCFVIGTLSRKLMFCYDYISMTVVSRRDLFRLIPFHENNADIRKELNGQIALYRTESINFTDGK